MTKTVYLKAVKGVKLAEMDQASITALVEKESGKILERLPKELQVSRVNSIVLESNPSEVAGGVWAQWTRACCGKRRLIDEFENPILEQLTDGITGDAVRGQDHFDENMSVRKIASVTKKKTGRHS